MTTNENLACLPSRPKKRLFLSLMFLALVCIAVIMFGLWRISYLGLAEMNPIMPKIVGVIFAVAIGFVLACLAVVALAVSKISVLPRKITAVAEKNVYHLINLLFPLSVRLGKLFGISRRTLEGSFIAVSNLLFTRRHIKVAADKLLVITPHCLQLASCPHKITRDPSNCKRCGGCNIGDLMNLSDELGFHFLVATGGTLARQMIKDVRPQAVLAVACERDLMSGIQDVYPLPAVGVLNIRPNGPCYNTRVNMDEVRKQLESIIVKSPDDEH